MLEMLKCLLFDIKIARLSNANKIIYSYFFSEGKAETMLLENPREIFINTKVLAKVIYWTVCVTLIVWLYGAWKVVIDNIGLTKTLSFTLKYTNIRKKQNSAFALLSGILAANIDFAYKILF